LRRRITSTEESMIAIRRGLDLPISGAPEQRIYDGPRARTVAVLGPDYHGMKPTMAVQVGDRVRRGDVLFSDKKTDGVLYTAPAPGVVSAINRGAKRALQSVVIDVEGDEDVPFASYERDALTGLERQQVVDNLVRSGQWTALRSRPFSRVPALDSQPRSVFVTATTSWKSRSSWK
jgi:Na+-transporting NADH:ubiquinone oxidoreductase subunit A